MIFNLTSLMKLFCRKMFKTLIDIHSHAHEIRVNKNVKKVPPLVVAIGLAHLPTSQAELTSFKFLKKIQLFCSHFMSHGIMNFSLMGCEPDESVFRTNRSLGSSSESYLLLLDLFATPTSIVCLAA